MNSFTESLLTVAVNSLGLSIMASSSPKNFPASTVRSYFYSGQQYERIYADFFNSG
jgi:hypothetical protein